MAMNERHLVNLLYLLSLFSTVGLFFAPEMEGAWHFLPVLLAAFH
jgi:hypothetical protein